jgi:hypothetical protein
MKEIFHSYFMKHHPARTDELPYSFVPAAYGTATPGMPPRHKVTIQAIP